MIINCKRTVCFLLVVLMLAFALASCNTDPNVKQDEEETKSYDVKLGEDEEEKELEGFHSYPAGKTDPVTVDGVEVSVTDFSLRAYELAYMIAQPKFDSADSIPVDALVQFAFAHVYFNNLNEMDNKKTEYRTASESQIRQQLKIYFGKDDFKVKDSVLYNAGKEMFEMWLPDYGCNIYYNIDAVDVDGSAAEITTTFFKELDRNAMLGRTKIKVKIKDGEPVIDSLSAE